LNPIPQWTQAMSEILPLTWSFRIVRGHGKDKNGPEGSGAADWEPAHGTLDLCSDAGGHPWSADARRVPGEIAVKLCRITLLAAVLALPAPVLAGQPVDVELALAVDVSGSVDGGEQDLQRTGLERVFRDPDVIDAIRALPRGLAAAVVGFAGAGQARTVVGWACLTVARSAEAFARRVAAAFPTVFDYAHKTAIGDALAWSLAELAGNGFDAGPRSTSPATGATATAPTRTSCATRPWRGAPRSTASPSSTRSRRWPTTTAATSSAVRVPSS
jgi:Protein of unknown function (DUF1194)